MSERESGRSRNSRSGAVGVPYSLLCAIALLTAVGSNAAGASKARASSNAKSQPVGSMSGASPSGANPSEGSQDEAQAKPWSQEGPLKIGFSFADPKSACQMALTRDSVGILKLDSTAGALEPDDENGFDGAVRKRALSDGEKDTADQLLNLTRIWKGRKRYTCPNEDGYAFTLWSDSLTLHCGNCFSCTEGVSMPEAKMLARIGKLSLWLYRLKGGMDVDLARE